MHPQNKMENDEVKKIRIKDRTCFYFDDIMKLKDFDTDNPIGIRRCSCVSFRSQIGLDVEDHADKSSRRRN